MHVWRIARGKYPPLDGEGARLYGGRWNSRGTPLVYAAGSRALATLELLVWTTQRNAPDDLCLYTVFVPDDSIQIIRPEYLDTDWRTPRHPGCRAIGDTWAAWRSTLAAAVPSAVQPNPAPGRPEEWNYLLNPRHPEMPRVHIVHEEAFEFDRRLLR